MIKRRILLPLTLALLWSGTTLARDYTQGSIVISDPWSRATPPSAMSGAGYLTDQQGQYTRSPDCRTQPRRRPCRGP